MTSLLSHPAVADGQGSLQQRRVSASKKRKGAHAASGHHFESVSQHQLGDQRIAANI